MAADKTYPEFNEATAFQDSDLIVGWRGGNPSGKKNIKSALPNLASYILEKNLPLKFIGDWNASTNTPALSNGSGIEGFVYRVSADGATSLDGISEWEIDDWAWFDGTVWRKNKGSSSGGSSEFIGFKARRTTQTAVVTGDATPYVIAFELEDYDEGDNFVTDTFTAPVDGYYLFNLNWGLTAVQASRGVNISIVINGVNEQIYGLTTAALVNPFRRSGSVMAYLEAGQTATSRVNVSLGGGLDVAVLANTIFSGELWAAGVDSIQAKAPNEQTGLTYTPVPGDAFRVINGTNAALQTYTMPGNGTSFFADGSMLAVSAGGDGQIEFVPEGGVTLEYADSDGIAVPKTRTKNSSVTWLKRTSTIWKMLGGDITA